MIRNRRKDAQVDEVLVLEIQRKRIKNDRVEIWSHVERERRRSW